MENKKYDIEAYDMNDVIYINRLLNEFDDIFSDRLDKKIFFLGGNKYGSISQV